MYAQILLNFLGIIAVISSINIWIILPTLALGIIFYILRRFYLSTARDVKRLEGISEFPKFYTFLSSYISWNNFFFVLSHILIITIRWEM